MEYIYPTFLENRYKPQNPFQKIICEDNEFVNEALGSFDKQNEIAGQIVDILADMWKNNETSGHKDIVLNGETIPLELEIDRSDSLTDYTRAEMNAMGHKDDGGTVFTGLKMKVTISQFDAYSLRGNDLKDKLLPIVAHELMHGNMFSLRIGHGKDIGTVKWYDTVVRILKGEKNETVRKFAYSMYACYFYERQAIISSTYSQLLEMFGPDRIEFLKNKTKSMDKQMAYDYLLKIYKNGLFETEAFQTYSMVSRFCKELTAGDIYIINRIFIKYGYEIKAEDETDHMLNVANEALKDVARNGSLFFYDVLVPLSEKKEK